VRASMRGDPLAVALDDRPEIRLDPFLHVEDLRQVSLIPKQSHSRESIGHSRACVAEMAGGGFFA
jgi:hypothetical protein